MKLRVIANGIFGANGEIQIGSEFEIDGPIPDGWREKVEVIKGKPVKDAKPITNPRRA